MLIICCAYWWLITFVCTITEICIKSTLITTLGHDLIDGLDSMGATGLMNATFLFQVFEKKFVFTFFFSDTGTYWNTS